MLNPAETAQAVSNSMEHKAHTPLVSIIFLAIMAGAAIAMGDIFWAHSTVGMAEKTVYRSFKLHRWYHI